MKSLPFTDAQITMRLQRAERQLARIIEQASAARADATHIEKTSHPVLHETVVGLVTLFREHRRGEEHLATRIAKEYANGADARAGAPTLACVQAILDTVRAAR